MRKPIALVLFAFLVFALAIPVAAQKPAVFDVSNVVVGAQKIQTLYFYAAGKWSDAGDHAGPLSTDIRCYKTLGFCDVASALLLEGYGGITVVALDTFDILRWDSNEIIAVDSSPICIVNTLRVDLATKRVTVSSSDKGVNKDSFCKGSDKLSTAVLWGMEDIKEDAINRAKAKQQNH
jgi:hypothetical protein